MTPSAAAAVIQVGQGISRAALSEVCSQVTAAAAEHRVVLCLVDGADLAVVHALATVELLCRRLGQQWSVRASCPAALVGVLGLVGLDVLVARLEVPGEPEPLEQ